MKRFAILTLFAFIAICAVGSSTDRCNYAISILKPNKEPLYNAHLYLYAGKSDSVGRLDIVGSYGLAGVAITPEGKAVEGAQIYLLSRRTDKAGMAELTTHKGRKAIIAHPNAPQTYIDYTFGEELEPSIIFDKPITVRLASYSGGLNGFRRELSQNIEFPDINARGEVRASFMVGKNGTIENIKITKTINRAFTEEVVTKMLKMPPWRPAMKDRQAVKCLYTVPLHFIGNDD